MADSVRLYGRLVGAELRSALEYPVPLTLNILATIALTGLDLVAVTAVFANVDALAGWSLAEVLLLYGVGQTGFYLADLVGGQLDQLPDLVRSGRLDVLLLRPRRVLFQMFAQDVDLRGVGKILQAAVALAVGLATAELAVAPVEVALRLVVALVGGMAIYLGIWVVTTSITFWLVDSREVSAAFTYGGRQSASYPLGIYSDWLRTLMRFVVPLAFTAYYPTLGLLGRDDPLGGASWLAWCGPLVAVAVGLVALVVWSTGIRAYRSVGA